MYSADHFKAINPATLTAFMQKRNCHDVCVDNADDLYVCQWNSKNVYPYKLHREA